MIAEISNDLNINWSIFEEFEQKLLKDAIHNGHHEHLAAILFDITPEKAEEIAKVQRQMRPREFKFESKAQEEFEIWCSQNGIHALTPEIQAEWQKKIDKEKEEKLKALGGGVIEVKAQNLDGSKEIGGTITNDLTNVNGLGPASIKRLNDMNIRSIDELRKLSQEDRKKILGPLVAGKLKNLI